MQRDNQGRQLLRLPTTMRLAFSAAFNQSRRPVPETSAPAHLVFASLKSNHGYRKVPAWTVTRKGKR